MREGVIVTASGLQYEILKQGDGAKPVLTSSVVVDYIGTKIDGTLFDSSYSRGVPATFTVSVRGMSSCARRPPCPQDVATKTTTNSIRIV